MATDDARCVPQISAEDEKEYEKQFKERGVDGCLKFIKEKQDSWKQVPINIGIIGNSGVGKSSFINAIRCLEDEYDPNFASIGVTDCTADIRPYEYPGNPKLKFWDLPGISAKYPREKYLETIKFKQYDFFFVISASRFTENDQWLARSITNGGKQLYFVRTKIGSDIDNDKKAHPMKHKKNPEGSVKSLIESIRQDITKNMQLLEIQCQFFLVDSYERHRNDLDFNELEKCLIDDFPEIKRDTLILSLKVLSTDMVNKKVEILKKRIWIAATLSAAGAAVPIPGVSLAIDFGILAEELLYYFKQLGLDSETVRKTSKSLSVDENRVKRIINDALPLYAVVFSGMAKAEDLTTDAIRSIAVQLMKEKAPTLVSEEFARYIPLIGILIAAPISFFSTSAFLGAALSRFQKVAHKVVNIYIGSTLDD